ncbi:baseplate J/gp47 family protein [Undibacterium macrobrachii]|uniref:Baseplate protein J-like domain-containing protein n=1 Tax=Undibacterium macrobrachii TaxID=1119058 RepID=A0ABQ2XCE5_9BURK|nr:baseplate J/gp47 family protein [Undibacterium macrobrachii]GGX10447.1 hypothetical protein GCM10011282_15930 [Undibacterium macrobrachii]
MKPQLIISDGRSQSQRQLKALRGEYFQLNEMRFEQLLSLASEYARLVKFHQLDLRVDGNWNQFFLADECILMANILAIDTATHAQHFEARLQSQPLYRDWFRDDIIKKIDVCYRDQLDSPLLLARLLNQYLLSLSVLQSNAAVQSKRLLEGILRGLKREVQTLCEATPRVLVPYSSALFSAQFKSLSDWPTTPTKDRPLKSNEGKNLSLGEVRHNFHTFNQALRMLQNGVRELLPVTMLSEEHDPAQSLLIAFIRLFEQLKTRLNHFGDKHIDFYYQQILGMRARAQIPDSAYLVLQSNPNTKQMLIDQTNEFVAGVDADQNEIIYKAESSTQLNDAKVVSLHSIYFEKNHEENRLLVTKSSYHQAIQVLPDDCQPTDHEKLPPLPLFGAPKPGEHLSGARATRFGFAIASKVLQMQEGERVVRVLFRFRDNAAYTIESSIKEITEHAQQKRNNTSNPTTSIRLSDVFIKLLRGMFKISLTTSDGWLSIGEYRPEYHELNADIPPNCLALNFVLPASAPAICAYQANTHGESFQTNLPVMMCEMTQNEYAYPYDILRNWFVQEIEIDTQVKGCRNLILHNQIGQLSALSPFLPFGPLPEIGSYLVVGSEEVADKQLQDISLDVEWTGLPNNLGGFPSHYRAYQTPLKADSVLAKISVLVDGKWNNATQAIPLFQFETRPDGSPFNQVNYENSWSLSQLVPLFKISNKAKSDGAVPFAYTSATMNGMFKISLDSPNGAFGHQEYPQLLTQVLTHNARNKKLGLIQALPNTPYTPQISRITLNYQATSKISFDQRQLTNIDGRHEQFMHLHPLGWEAMSHSDMKRIALVPRYPAAGNLFIGLTASQLRATLSLYFYLREDSLPLTKLASTGLCWWYLSSNRWRKMQPANILDDSTFGFMTSGIVQIQIPDEIDQNNTVMPSGLYWLAVSAEYGLERFCSLYGVFAQAIKVNYLPDSGKKNESSLAAFSIQRSRTQVPGLRRVLQLRRSFNGRDQETTQQFRIRASERLKHKNRALTAADYEQLILEQFPQVYKIKCFPHLCSAENPHHRLCPGQLLIVPIPHLSLGGHANQKPSLSGHLIQEIQAYIQQFAPADVTISVENPTYEEIQVRCTVKLKSAYSNSRFAGRYVEEINQAICDYLSPWIQRGQTQHFGWAIQQHNVVAFLHDLEYVDEVTGVSLLQIAPLGDTQDLRYDLHDNAKAIREEKNLRPNYPWSIAVPMNEHWIVVNEQFEQKPAKAIGINELKVGSTFIIPVRKEP